MGTSRQTLTFLFVDIVKSTDFKGSVEEDVSKPVFDRCFAIFAECMPADPAAGKMQTNTGDGMYAWFPSPTDAVETALRIQWRFHGENWPLRRIEVRQGLDMGDASTIFDPVHQEDQPYTFRTHVTARIMDLAQPGQILMSRDVRSMVSTTLGRHPFARDESPPDADLTLQRPIHGNYRYKGDKVDEGLEEPIEIAEIRPAALGPCVKPGANDKGGYPCDGEGRAISGWTPWVGDIVPGISPNKWQLEQRLGVGGFGTVWLARDLSTDDVSAFKFCDDRLRAQSFVREWKLFLLLRKAVSLDPALRPNIAVLQSSSLQSIKGDDKLRATPPFWIQSRYYPEGNILEWALKRHGKPEDQLTPVLSPEERHEHLCKALALIHIEVRLNLWVELARTVHAVHHHGITHRDIKPTNILIRLDPSDGSPHPVLADFGIGTTDDPKSLEAINQSQWGFRNSDFIEDISRTGTALYRPQEALLRAEPTYAWDIHALAVLLYQFVRGDASLPLSHSWDQHVDDPILRADIRKGVLDGDKRWRSAAEFAESVAERDERRRVMEEENAREQLRIEQQKAKRRRIFTTVMALLTVVAASGAWFGLHQAHVTEQERAKTAAALVESNRQLERSYVEEGRAWLERGRVAESKGDHARALLLAGRALGYSGFGRRTRETESFSDTYRPLLSQPMQDPIAFMDSAKEAAETAMFLNSIYCTLLPLWAGRVTANVRSIAFSADCTRLASGSDDQMIKIWDVATGKELASLDGHAGVTNVVFSPDCTHLASSSWDNTVRLWNTATGKEIASLKGHVNWVTSIAFTPDSTRLASGSVDKTIRLWEAATGKELACLQGHDGYVTSVAFSPDGTRLISGSEDKTIKLWDAASGEELSSLQGHNGTVLSVAFSPDGSRLVTGSEDNAIKLWDVASAKEVANLRGHNGYVESVAFSPDGTRLASGSNDKNVKLWDIATSTELASVEAHEGTLFSVAFTPDGSRLVTGSGDGTIKLWDVAPGKELTKFPAQNGAVFGVSFSPDGTCLASSSEFGTIKIWDVATGMEIASLRGHTRDVTGVAFSPDGTRIATSSNDETIKLWDAQSGKEIATLLGHKGTVWCVVFSSDGARLASGSDDKTIKLWDIATCQELIKLQAPAPWTASLAFSPTGNRLASGFEDNTIKVWDAITGKELASLKGHTDHVLGVAFSRDGKLLASASFDKTIKLWDVRNGQELANFQGHKEAVLSVAFSPDGTCLASSSEDATIRLWDTARAEELAILQGHGSWVTSVAFNPDGTRLASGSFDATVRLWNVAMDKDHTRYGSIQITSANQGIQGQRSLHSLEQNRVIPDRTKFLIGASTLLDLTASLRTGLASFDDHKVVFPTVAETSAMTHYRPDTLAQLADPKLTPTRRAELRMELCTKSRQFRASTAQWQALQRGEWPGVEGAIVSKDQAPTTISADSPIRRLYLLALIDATKHPQIHGHPTICQTAAQIAPVLTKEMIATPTISLAMMSLMQTLAKDDSPDMKAPRETLLQRLKELASKEWLEVLHSSTAK